MYSSYPYQIMEQSDIQLILRKVTLETATDVTYHEQDICDVFCGGERYTGYAEYANESSILVKTNSEGGWGEKSDHVVYFVFVPSIIRAVTRELTKNPKALVQLDLDEHHVDGLKLLNKLFKQSGFMFRPKFGHFVTYKAGKPKPKKVAKNLLNDVRSMLTSHICQCINDKLGGSICIGYPNNKLAQIGAVRLAKCVGIKFDQAMKHTTYGNLYDYIARRADPEVKDQTLQEIKDWWKEHYTTKFTVTTQD